MWLYLQEGARVTETAWLSLGPLIKARSVDNDLTVGRQFDVGAIHRARRRAFEVDAFAVIAAAVTRALEFVFAGFPVRRAAEMSAARVDNETTIGSAVDTDAVFLLPLGVDAERVVGWIANFEDGGGFEECARQEEAEEGDKPSAEKTGDCTPHKAST